MIRTFVTAWATLSSAPWRRAPLLLWRRPGVLVAVAGACAVTVAAVAAVPLFLSSAGTASVGLQAAERCPRDTGVTHVVPATPADVRSPGADPFAPLAGRLGPTNRWLEQTLVPLAAVGAEPTSAERTTLLARDGATDRVDLLAGGDRPGVWITDRAAEATGLAVGERATIGGVEVPVAAVYRDLASDTLDRFWCSNTEALLVRALGGDLVMPPPVVLADRDTFADVMERGGTRETPSVAEAPLGPDLTVAAADDLVAELACHGEHAADLTWCADGQPLLRDRARGPLQDAAPAIDDRDFVERFFRSSLPFVTERSRAIRTSVGSGIWPVATFAALAGLGLVAAAAALWFDRRRREVVLLSTRGVSPGGLGLKAVLELSTAMAAGGLAGIALAWGLVVWLGPTPTIEAGAVGRAAWGAGAALVVAATTLAAVVAVRVRSSGAQRVRRLALAAVPWEVALVALTVLSYRRLEEWGVPSSRGAGVSRVDVLGLLFPVLFLLTAVALVSRVLAVALRPLRAASRAWPSALYLAVRRVARARAAVLGLLAASAVAVGVLVYATTMDGSLHATLEAKAGTFVGSDVAVRIPDEQELPAALAGRSTEVEVHRDAWVERDEREDVVVVTVDTATFGDVAFWDPTFADVPLEEILDRLAAPTTDGSVPAVAVDLDLDGPTEAGIGEGAAHPVTLVPVADVDAFPGAKRKPTVFVDSAALAGADIAGARREAWVRGDRDEVLAELRRAGVPFEETRRATEVADRSSFVTVSWTFGFLRSLGLSAGALALGGVAVHLDARRRDRALGHAFLRRMGLTARQHRRALLAELVATILVGCGIGLAAALAVAWLAHAEIDPVPGLPPGPLLRPSVEAVVASSLVSITAVVVAAVVAQRRVERDDPVEVLRAGA